MIVRWSVHKPMPENVTEGQLAGSSRVETPFAM